MGIEVAKRQKYHVEGELIDDLSENIFFDKRKKMSLHIIFECSFPFFFSFVSQTNVTQGFFVQKKTSRPILDESPT